MYMGPLPRSQVLDAIDIDCLLYTSYKIKLASGIDHGSVHSLEPPVACERIGCGRWVIEIPLENHRSGQLKIARLVGASSPPFTLLS